MMPDWRKSCQSAVETGSGVTNSACMKIRSFRLTVAEIRDGLRAADVGQDLLSVGCFPVFEAAVGTSEEHLTGR